MIFDGDERYDSGNVDVLQTVSDGYNKPERVSACEFLFSERCTRAAAFVESA